HWTQVCRAIVRDKALAREIGVCDRAAAVHQTGRPEQNVTLPWEESLQSQPRLFGARMQRCGELLRLRVIVRHPEMIASEQEVRQGVAAHVILQLARPGLDIFQRDPRSDKLQRRIDANERGVLVNPLLRAVIKTERLESERRPFKD